MSVGQRIKAAREQAGITQVELGEKIGVSGVAIMRYEKGTREPRLQQLRQIAQALDADVVYLISGQTSAEVERGILEQAEIEAKYYVKGRFAEAETWKARKDEIGKDLAKLNDDGQIEAVKRVKELTEVPRYQYKRSPSPLSASITVYGDGPAGSFPPAPEPPQPPAEPEGDTNTTPGPEGPEKPTEGK